MRKPIPSFRGTLGVDDATADSLDKTVVAAQAMGATEVLAEAIKAISTMTPRMGVDEEGLGTMERMAYNRAKRQATSILQGLVKREWQG